MMRLRQFRVIYIEEFSRDTITQNMSYTCDFGGSQLLHPKATTSLMTLHLKGKKVVHYIPGLLHPKWHYIEKATTSHKPLHPTMLLHPMYHFIPYGTSSHRSLHLRGYFIQYTTSSHMLLHPIYLWDEVAYGVK